MDKKNFIVKEIPEFSEKLESYAGQINVTKSDSLFFWLFPAPQSKPKKLVIWLNGGPGCTSLDGLFLEHGAISILDGKLTRRNHTWSDHVDVLYLDQPIGTGYSQGRLRTNMTEITSDFMAFVDGFRTIFTEYQTSEIFLAGESFAVN